MTADIIHSSEPGTFQGLAIALTFMIFIAMLVMQFMLRWIFTIATTEHEDGNIPSLSVKIFWNEFINSTLTTFVLVTGRIFDEAFFDVRDGSPSSFFLWTIILHTVYFYYEPRGSANPLSYITNQWGGFHRVVEDSEKGTENEQSTDTEDEKSTDKTERNSSSVRRRVQTATVKESIATSRDVRSAGRVRPPKYLWASTLLSQTGVLFVTTWYMPHSPCQSWQGRREWIGGDTRYPMQLNTGPIQGMLVEAVISFLLPAFAHFFRSDSGFAFSLMSAFFQSAVYTALTFVFYNLTGAFGNPLIAYVMQRGCLNDVGDFVNHIIVYVIGGVIGSVTYKTIFKKPPHCWLELM